MYNITERKEFVLDPVQVEQETLDNLLSLSGIDPVIAKIMDIDIEEEMKGLRLLAQQLTTNLIRQEGEI